MYIYIYICMYIGMCSIECNLTRNMCPFIRFLIFKVFYAIRSLSSVRSQSPPGLIMRGLDKQVRKSLIISDNQVFHDVSPNLSNSVDDSPDQTVDRIKIEYHLPILTIHHTPPGLPLGVNFQTNRTKKNLR